MGGNNTTVSVGLLAGALVTILVTILNSYVGVQPPVSGELAAAMSVLVTALVQWFLPRNEA